MTSKDHDTNFIQSDEIEESKSTIFIKFKILRKESIEWTKEEQKSNISRRLKSFFVKKNMNFNFALKENRFKLISHDINIDDFATDNDQKSSISAKRSALSKFTKTINSKKSKL